MTSIFKTIKNFIPFLSINYNVAQVQQVRTKFVDWRMVKDHRKRQTFKQYGAERLRINSLRKNRVLPIEIREIADKEIAAYPRDAAINRIVARCCLTSRPRGVVRHYRISRICFRHLADYNCLSGVQRGIW